MNRSSLAAMVSLAAVLFVLAPSLGAETLKLKVFPKEGTTIYINGSPATPSGEQDYYGLYPHLSAPISIRIVAEGYQTHQSFIPIGSKLEAEIKLERSDSKLEQLIVFPTGDAPKSVEFVPGRPPGDPHMVVAYLNEHGAGVYDLAGTRIAHLQVPGQNWNGFVESAFDISSGRLFISQMTTGQVHVFRLSDYSYETSIELGGQWSKVIVVDQERRRMFVSHWISGTISEVNLDTLTETRVLPCGGTPRGMALDPSGRYLYVARFDNGQLIKIDLNTGTIARRISTQARAMRHLVAHPGGQYLMASDMHPGQIHRLRWSNDSVVVLTDLGHNPNTMALSPDGSLAFVSTRGDNNPTSYLIKGPEFGKVYAIDLQSGQVVDWTWGGNQPTGLAISDDGRYLAFTDFLDDRLEVYAISSSLSH